MSSSLCSVLIPLYQSWKSSLASLEDAKKSFQETGSDEDKKRFEECLLELEEAKKKYFEEAYKPVKFRGREVIAAEAIVLEHIYSSLPLTVVGNFGFGVKDSRVVSLDTGQQTGNIDKEICKKINPFFNQFKNVRNLYLSGLTTAEHLTLPQSIGGGLYLNSLTTAEHLSLPQSIGGDLDLYGLTTAKHLTLPRSIGGYLDLRGLTTIDNLDLSQVNCSRLIFVKQEFAEELRKKYSNLNFRS